MEAVLDAIRAALPRLRPAEAKVAAAVLAAPESALEATVATLAEAADASQASVVRFARAIGFSGLPELRIALAKELSRRKVELERSSIAEGEINADDSLAEVVAKIAFHEARSIEQTARLVDLEALDQVATALAQGRPAFALGVGASALAASDLAQKLQRIGLVCQFSPDTHLQLVHGAMATSQSVALAFSFGGRTGEVYRALSLAAERSALTVAVTNEPESPIGRVSDVVLHSSAREAQLRAAALASRMSQLAIVDFLFIRVAQLRFDDVEAALERTRTAVEGQRLPGRDA